jgi:hypothetical protein
MDDLQRAFDAGFEAVKAYVDREFTAFEQRLAAIEARATQTREDPPLAEMVAAEVVKAVAALPPARPGKDADPEAIRAIIAEAVAALPPAEPGKDADPAEIRRMVDEAVAALPPARPGKDADPEAIRATIAEAVAALLPAEPGKDADPAEIRRMVDEAVAALPPARPGRDADPEVIKAMVAEAVAALPPAEPGRDADPVEIRRMVNEAVAALPPAEPAKDADPDVTADLVRAEVAKAVGALPKPQDGKSVTLEDVVPLIAQEVEKAVGAIPAPKDGVGLAGALIDRSGALVVTLTNGDVKTLGAVVGRDADAVAIERSIAEKVAALPKPRDGADGLGFDDLDVIYDGARSFTLRFMRGDQTKEFGFDVPVMIYRGVFKDGESYAAGDTVTWGGSLWHCDEPTGEKPGDGQKGWRLAVKRGQNGKDGVVKEIAPPQPVRLGAPRSSEGRAP